MNTERKEKAGFMVYLMYNFVLDNIGAGSSRDVKHEIDVFGDPDGWIQDNAQKRKKMSGVYFLRYKCCFVSEANMYVTRNERAMGSRVSAWRDTGEEFSMVECLEGAHHLVHLMH